MRKSLGFYKLPPLCAATPPHQIIADGPPTWRVLHGGYLLTYTPFRAATVAAVFWLGAAATATAADSSIQMQAIRDKGPGPVIGTVHAVEIAEGRVLELDLAELPPGPNRLFLHDAGDCSVPRGELLSSARLAVVNVDITEDGAEPLKQALVVPGASLAELSLKALVIYRGGQMADLGPEQTGLLCLVV